MVHAGTLLVRRLLHHTALVRIALPGSHLDWIACYASITANVNSGHIAILEFAQNLQLNQIVAAYFHCHICLANSSWPDSFIREFRRFIGLYALAFNILLGMRLFPNRNHVHSWLRRHLLYNGTRARLYRLVHPHWLGKLFLSVLFLPLYLFLSLSLCVLSLCSRINSFSFARSDTKSSFIVSVGSSRLLLLLSWASLFRRQTADVT